LYVFLGSAKKEVLILIFRARQKEFQKKFRFCCNILILESKKKKLQKKKIQKKKKRKKKPKQEAETRSQKEASEQRTHGGRRLRALLLLS
jgi:hypothetical protein